MALKDAFEPFQPFSAEPLALFVTAAGRGDDDVRGGVVVEEPLLKLRGVFVDFHFVGDGLRLPEAPKEGVERVIFPEEKIKVSHICSLSSSFFFKKEKPSALSAERLSLFIHTFV